MHCWIVEQQFINCTLVKGNSIPTCKLKHLITVYNINGTENRGERITKEVTLIMSHLGHKERAIVEVCDLRKTI